MVMIAVTFVFHLGSNTTMRISRASIKILPYHIQGDKTFNVRKIPYFSPHAVFGKFSRESSIWQFVPGDLNMNRAPATSAIPPHRSLMMIQGSVRSFEGLEQGSLLWTVEEDQEGCSGTPNEFTFSFAVLQEVARDPFRLHIQIVPTVIYLTSEDIPSTNLQYRRQICHAEAQYSSSLNGFQFGEENLLASDNVEERLNTMVELSEAPWPTY
ncbi:hypothetical protein BDZ45DRAFT_579465 [Acephala macrosclerotiorum]|nr:hypothetical protein BDZ45DRAFT_579465 [Acephala macrosclerotiorum]